MRKTNNIFVIPTEHSEWMDLTIFCFIVLFSLALCACSTQKPEPAPTQIVNGKSIVIPPDFDLKPETKNTPETKTK